MSGLLASDWSLITLSLEIFALSVYFSASPQPFPVSTLGQSLATGYLLVERDHVTRLLASDWPCRVWHHTPPGPWLNCKLSLSLEPPRNCMCTSWVGWLASIYNEGLSGVNILPKNTMIRRFPRGT